MGTLPVTIYPHIDLRPCCEYERWPGVTCRVPARAMHGEILVCGVHQRTLILREARHEKTPAGGDSGGGSEAGQR